jgi:hypothetical protein
MPVYAYEVSVTLDVGVYLSVVMNYNSFNYGILLQGSNNNPAPNQENGIYNATINTNKEYKVSARGTDFSGDAGSFSISNLKMDTNSTKEGLSLSSAKTLSTTDVEIDTNIPPEATTNYHGYWVSIPAGQNVGRYSTTVTLTFANV